MISVRHSVVGKHMSVKPAVRKTQETGGGEEGRLKEPRKKDGNSERNTR